MTGELEKMSMRSSLPHNALSIKRQIDSEKNKFEQRLNQLKEIKQNMLNDSENFTIAAVNEMDALIAKIETILAAWE